jgi:hypothetical protein
MGRRLRSRPLRIWISILLWRPDHGYVLYDRLLCRVRAKDSGGKLKGAIRLHRDLEWVHGPGMILTPLLGIMAYKQENAGEEVHGIASYHGTAAYVTGPCICSDSSRVRNEFALAKTSATVAG